MEETTLAVGPVTFVVEHRHAVQDGIDSSGPTIRVLGTEDRHEYLRFDMFNSGAHYHYEPPGAEERIVRLDVDAEGEPLAWAIEKLRGRLGPMLVAAGGQHLADALVVDPLTRAIDELAVLARS